MDRPGRACDGPRIMRTASLATSLVGSLVVVTACGGAPAPMPIHEMHLVAVAGEQADTLGETLEGPLEGHVLVHTHDGRELWVPEASLRTPALETDGWVLLAHAGGIVPAQVVRPLDDFLELRVGSVVGIAPMHAILAILHSPPSVPVSPEATFATPGPIPEGSASPSSP